MAIRRRPPATCLNRYTFCNVPTKLEEIVAATRRQVATAKASADLGAMGVAA
jgi:hypothetical protein